MDFMIAKRHFFRHVAASNLTGEQLRVLMCLLSREADGVIGMWQKEIAEMLGIAEPNVSRSIKALMQAGILGEKVTTGYKDIPIFTLKALRAIQTRRQPGKGARPFQRIPPIPKAPAHSKGARPFQSIPPESEAPPHFGGSRALRRIPTEPEDPTHFRISAQPCFATSLRQA